MKLKKLRTLLLASSLGAALILGGCKAAEEPGNGATPAGQSMTQKGSDAAGNMATKATEMAEKAEDAATDAVDTGMEMANAAFDSSMELTETTAEGAKVKMESAIASMEEQFNGMKETLDPPKTEEIEAKFASVKNNLAELKDKTGAELAAGLQEVRQEGSELATEISSLAARTTGEEDTVVSEEATPAMEEKVDAEEVDAAEVDTTPEVTATPEAQ